MTHENLNSSHGRLEKLDFASSIRRVLPAPSSALFTLLVVGLVLFVQSAGAWPLGDTTATNTLPSMIRYQGRLTDLNGVPQGGEFDMVFRLYTQPDKPVDQWDWKEEHTAAQNARVKVENGLFNVWLGSLNPIDPNLLAGGDLYLGVQVAGDEEMSPRERLTGVPFALLASAVADRTVTTAKLADNAVTSVKIQDGGVGTADLAGGAVTSAKIQDGEVTTADIKNNDIRSGDILDGEVKTADLAGGVVTSAKIADNTITEADIADNFKARDADKLDGLNSTDFASSGHNHDGRYYTEGESDSRFASSSHHHDGRYYTEGESDSRFVNASGDSMSGNLDMGGRQINNVNSIQIGGQGTISDKRDSGDGGPHMVFQTDDCFTFQNNDGMRLRLCGNQYGVGYQGNTWHYFNNTIVPDTGYVYDLGEALGRKWRSIYVRDIFSGDVAEDIDLNYEEPETGDVLVWQDGKLVKSTQANDRNVFGVAKVTEDKPAGSPVILGVFVIKVTGTVREGDLLVTSDVPGHAMAAGNPATGTVIATALESFKGDSGLIKAMVRKF